MHEEDYSEWEDNLDEAFEAALPTNESSEQPSASKTPSSMPKEHDDDHEHEKKQQAGHNDAGEAVTHDEDNSEWAENLDEAFEAALPTNETSEEQLSANNGPSSAPKEHDDDH